MAEHLRNELARANIPIRPNRIQTLAKFIDPFTPLAEAPDSLLHLLIARHGPKSEFPSYHRALAALLVGQVPDLPREMAQIAQEIENQLAQRGVALREKRIRSANPIVAGPIILDGFFTLSPAELDLLEKLKTQTAVTVTLPDWPGSTTARDHLLSIGFTEQHLDKPLRHSTRTVRAAPSLDQEVEQIALTILERIAKGREFREIGVLLRVRDPYASALESTFARLGIPARFHFADPLSAHPAIQYLTGLIRSLLSGWDHADLLTLLRMPVSGIGATPAGDILDFEIRESLPSSGAGSRPALRVFELDPWKADRLTPADWATTLKTLRAFVPVPQITDQADRDQLQIWRTTAAALNAFDEALEVVAAALPNEPMPLAKFWPHVETAVAIEKLRSPDRRRNVVNVLDIHEARQWELPVAFVCGLNERHFPQYHRENPLLPDPTRTAARQQEEHFLYELAITRATEETILSYARFNDKGDPQLRSFFLEEEGSLSNLPRLHLRSIPVPDLSVGQVPDLPVLKLSPTSIESFLQCPFQFFAAKTLKLRKPPEKPRDRLNALVQGSILHRALAEGNLDRVFEEECQKNNIPQNYRTEAVRLELQRHFEAFQSNENWPLNWPSQTEQKFELALTPELSIRGRIDRLDRGPDNQAIVIDYKYSAAAKIKERIAGDPIQAGLYLLAAERYFHFKPVGMFYCGLRQSVTWEGWHTNIPGMKLGEARTSLRELIDAAENKTIEVHQSILAGNKAVRPADRDKCRYCDYNNICRIESSMKQHPALSVGQVPDPPSTEPRPQGAIS
ncbi:MAG TPA: PD-(D/E)XK nuclease family protein [Bryobacteraceae bacterium]|jgi:ATP-dependent helicase/DNAse subunit B|nr:PD-(D/E)XK nuclease family protein [Bryobacteraceae bacterium]